MLVCLKTTTKLTIVELEVCQNYYFGMPIKLFSLFIKDYLFQECHQVLFNQFWRIKLWILENLFLKIICQKISLKLTQILHT